MEVGQQVQARLDQVAKLPRAARAGIILGLCVALGAGYYFSYYQGARDELKRMHTQELELQRKLSEVRSVAANIGAFEEEIAELETQLTESLRQLPNEKQLEVLLTDISNLGKTSGVELKSFKRRSEVVHDFYAEVPIDIELRGNYHDVARFFDLMAKLPRIVNMGSIDIKVDSENIDETVLQVDGTATTFRFVGSKA
jgi:type IV pilus assembly protein PilO